MIPQETSVIRNGTAKLIHSAQLVPGDVVALQAGDRVSADLRLFFSKNLELNESTLTGESHPSSKRIEPIPVDAGLPERKNIVFNGTYVTSGTGLGVVIATGLNTEFGKISELVENVTKLETPMSLALKNIARWITFGVFFVSIALFFIGYLRGSSIFDASFAAITLAVAAIPEGLPAIITIASSIGVRRMARKQAIIRQLPAVEALGSASVICTDKTGTLTYNEMTVQRIWTPHGQTFVSGAGYSPEGHFESIGTVNQEELEEILRVSVVCSDATMDVSSSGSNPVGDPTEIALVVAGKKIGFNENEMREKWERIDVIPFESEKRIMATLNDSPFDQRYIFLKGAPEEIVARCDHLDNSEEILSHASLMAKEGMRVLAIAKREAKQAVDQLTEDEIKNGFHLLGFIGMIDPPRKEVYRALKSCHEAGIIIKMVTGDHPLTARAIATDLGILGHGKVLTGKEVNNYSSEEWKEASLETNVFARVTPEHKLKIVVALQSLGHVVAMTGDGVNDAAALKRADIGVAMGIKGTAVAKEASDMILADDNFASIEAAVEEGRLVYDNLIKSLAFIFPVSLGQALVIFLSVLFFPINNERFLHPMSPIQILWINLIVAVALSLPLAFESADQNMMQRPPRKKNKPLFDRYLMIKTVTVATVMAVGTIGLFLWEYQRELIKGITASTALAEAQTVSVTAMMFFQVFYLFNCRSSSHNLFQPQFFSNPYLFLGIGIVFIAQTAFIYLPFMNTIFNSAPLDLESILISSLVTLILFLVSGVESLIKPLTQNER